MKRYVLKNSRIFTLTALFTFVLLLASCVSSTSSEKEALPTETSSTPAAKEAVKTTASGAQPAPADGLNAPSFRGLPAEARDYLKTLAKAFREKDKAFLVSQGEMQYENELRLTLEEECYLALLYRIGPYSEVSHWGSPARGSDLPRLDSSKVRGIEYTAWEEQGPMLEIKGRLYMQNSSSIPCRLVLIWRLPEPKILGERP